ncbi:sensor histidine kinase [Sphingobacterium psychroaquaticum]|uniref:Histidine kinase n=1 Tax=Sphingobacterium psychroaquaticum TaxID=561061 RepID=A0A1X7I610_9SPHI|nr:histidine kinase [Sphingobacterium psychroaquaticum]SMG09536.1 Histidine kinase [Sphingobacterium psychroaquaticum]
MHQSKFYRLIVDPEYRIGRHLFFIVTLGIITFNQVFIGYQESLAHLGGKIYLIGLLSFATYLLTTYVNYFVLIPKFLLRERYVTYVLSSVIFVFLLLCVGISMEYSIRTFLGLSHRIISYTNPLILVDSLSASAITIICFWSMCAVTLFRKWNTMNAHIMALEYKYLESEVNKLKGQVSPVILSKALQKAAYLANSDAQKSSQILMQLGQLLRYQLYECDREKVFLHSEITFIKQFLELKKLITDDPFDYHLEVKGNTNKAIISPLLVIVLLQSILVQAEVKQLDVVIEAVNKNIVFQCKFTDRITLADENRQDVMEKLDTLYPDLYALTVYGGSIELKLEVV